MTFINLFAQVLTPVTLISGVGLLLLSMVNRYNHLTSRTRSLNQERSTQPKSDCKNIDLLLHRCMKLRNAIISLLFTIMFAALMIVVLMAEHILKVELSWLQWGMLLGALVCLLFAILQFALDFKVSLNVLRQDVAQAKNAAKQTS